MNESVPQVRALFAKFVEGDDNVVFAIEGNNGGRVEVAFKVGFERVKPRIEYALLCVIGINTNNTYRGDC